MIDQAEFVQRCVAAANDLALLYAGEPEEKMLAALHQTRANLEAKLAEPFGPDGRHVAAVDVPGERPPTEAALLLQSADRAKL